MFVVGGFNAYPAEIEAIFRGHVAVGQVAVVGVPDDRMGEVGCAYVVPPTADADHEYLGRSILGWSRGAMANYKVPRGVVLVEALPVNASGKVLKRELRSVTRTVRTTWSRTSRRRREEHTMRGIVYTGEGVEVTDALEVRGPGPNEVQVRIQAAGVCHSDLSVIDGTIPFPAPAVLGHEGAGVVEAVGDAVRSVKPGDHVVIATLAAVAPAVPAVPGTPRGARARSGTSRRRSPSRGNRRRTSRQRPSSPR